MAVTCRAPVLQLVAPRLLIVLLLLGGVGVVVTSEPAVGQESGPDQATMTPYRTQTIRDHWWDGTPLKNFDFGFLLTDLDGDGDQELVTGGGKHLLGEDSEDGGIKPVFQINLEPGWTFQNLTGKNLAVVSDLDGNGSAELNVVAMKDDRSAWRFLSIDAVTQEVLVDVPLPLGEDRRPDGVWDAFYLPIGWLDDADGQGNPAVALLCVVQYDATGRGVLAIDPRDGHIVWRWVSGANPEPVSAQVVDLDGDGSSEVLFFGTSPDNLDGQLINGLSDDVSRLIVLSNRGELLWREDLGGALQHGEVSTYDLDGDGTREVITHTSGGLVGEINCLVVWDYAHRARLVTKRQAARFYGLAIVPGPDPGSHWFFTGSDDGYVTRFRYSGRQLIQEARRIEDHTACRIIGAVDILPTAGTEIFATLDYRDLVVYNTDLEPQAVFPAAEMRIMRSPTVWHRTSQDSSLVFGSNLGYSIVEFAPNSRPIPAAALYAGAGLLALLGMTFAYRTGRNRGRREGVSRSDSPQVADREVLMRVWRQLDDVKHERFLEVNRGLRRLVWLLDAYTADLGTSDNLRERIGQLLDDFGESMHPRLSEVLRLARAENFESALVARTTTALDALWELLKGLKSSPLTVATVQESSDRMKQEVNTVADGFTRLWLALRRYFSTDPLRMLRGMILVREVEFERAGIAVNFSGTDDDLDPVCLIDSGGLRFVLDNLVNNAIHAMADSPRKQLDLAVSREGREVTVRVSDTGCGVPDPLLEKVFNGRTANPAGGGTGLFRSRDILHKWGGEISLAETSFGEGTTFIVRLRAARSSEAPVESPQSKTAEA